MCMCSTATSVWCEVVLFPWNIESAQLTSSCGYSLTSGVCHYSVYALDQNHFFSLVFVRFALLVGHYVNMSHGAHRTGLAKRHRLKQTSEWITKKKKKTVIVEITFYFCALTCTHVWMPAQRHAQQRPHTYNVSVIDSHNALTNQHK